MLTITKVSKCEDLSKFFTVVPVTYGDNNDDLSALLRPQADLINDLKDGKINEKKFAKKYKKFLTRTNTLQEWAMYCIAKSLKQKTSVAIVCSDDEWKLGYLKILAEVLYDTYGVTAEKGTKEVSEALEEELSSYEKKERKAFKAFINGDTEATEKQLKVGKSVYKSVKKAMASSFEGNGEEAFEDIESRFAIEQLALELITSGAVTVNKDNEVKTVDIDKCSYKSKEIINILMAPTSDAVTDNGAVAKFVKKQLKNKNLKYKENKLKDLSKEDLIRLVISLYSALTVARVNRDFEDD